MRPALRPLKSLKTSSTVLGTGCGIPSIRSQFRGEQKKKVVVELNDGSAAQLQGGIRVFWGLGFEEDE